MLSATPSEKGQTSHDFFESFYSRWNGGKFCRVQEPEKELPLSAKKALEDFRANISDEDFSCVGAKAALNGKIFRFGFYGEMNTVETDRALARDLRVFADEQSRAETNFASFEAIFRASHFENENVWETSLWNQVENLHRLDVNSDWDTSVSSNPDDIYFSFSFS